MKLVRKIEQVSDTAVIGLILAVSLLGRLIAAPFFSNISGGDYFNFLLITKQLVRFKTPFIAKRLPFYPLLLIPGHLGGFPVVWGKILGIAAGLGILGFVYLLCRELGLSRRVTYLALIFASVQSTLFVYSLRLLSHTVFTLEMVASLWLMYRLLQWGTTPQVEDECARKNSLVKSSEACFAPGRAIGPKAHPPMAENCATLNRAPELWYIFFGLLLGAMCMTRHEGFLVALVLGLSYFAIELLFLVGRKSETRNSTPEPVVPPSHRNSGSGQELQTSYVGKDVIKHTLLIFIPLLLIVTPYFVSNYIRFGNPVYSSYAEDRGLNPAADLHSLRVNLEEVKWLILNLWGETGYFPIKGMLLPGVVVLSVWVWLRGMREMGEIWEVIRGAILIGGIGGLAVLGPFETVLQFASFLLACVMFVGLVKFVIDLKWLSLPMLLLLVTQTAFITLIQPWGRHLQHTFVFWTLFLAVGIDWLVGGIRCRSYIKAAAVVCITALVVFNNFKGVQEAASSHREATAKSESLFKAVNYARKLEGTIGFETDWSVFKYYFGDCGRYYIKGQEVIPVNKISANYIVPVDEQIAWIESQNLDYVFRYYLFNIFDVVQYVGEEDYADKFKRLERFENEQGGITYWTEIHKVVHK